MLSKENVNNYETPSNKKNLIPINNSMKNQKYLQIFCKDLSKINIQDECGWTPLYRTVVAGDIFATTLLLNNGADPNVQCSMGETPLYQAVDMEKIEHVKLLLKNGANPNISNDDGFTPLHVAVNKQNTSIVKILLKFGANPNLKSKLYKQTPLHLAIKNNTDPMILLLLVQFNGSLTNEDKFRKKPIDYTNSKEMQSTIEKLKFGQENPKIEKENEVQNFQTPEKKYGWTASNVYTNTIRSQSHSKNFVVEGSNAILQNPGNVILNVINGKNMVSNAKNNNSNNNNSNNDNTIETVKKGLFNTNEEISVNSNDNVDISKTLEDKNKKIDNIDNNENNNNEKIDNIDIQKEEKEDNTSNEKIEDINKSIKKTDLNEDKENINPNNNINMSILLKKTKTGKFATIQEENSSNESRNNNNSLKPNIIRRSLTNEKSKEEDKETYHRKNFSFSTNTFNNNKNKEYSTSSKKVEKEKKENSSHYENKKTINIDKSKDNINININFNKDDLSGSKKKASTNESYYSNTKKKILIKSYYNKEGKKGNNNNSSSYSTKESEKGKDKDMSKYLYEKIIKKSITKIEIYDEYDDNQNKSQNSQKKSQKIKTETSQKNIKSNSSNKCLYNKPILKNKFNFKKSDKKIYVRPSIELELNNSSGCIEKKILRRKTFSRNNVKVNHQKQMTKSQIVTNPNIEANKNQKIKSEKTYSMSRTSLTTLGASKNEQNYNKNSLWKFLNSNANEKNERIFNQSITSNNMNTELDNIYEENYRYPIYDWLKEINLHCYYNLFTQKNIFSMDKVIHNLNTGKFNINKSDIEKIGIIIPGHIYRIITKLEIDSGKIKENISNFLIKSKKRMSGRDINIINNSIYFCCGCSGSNEQIHSYTLNKKMFNLDQWLNKIKMIKYKDTFVENGFDYFEYFILQMFSTIPVDDYILREELKIENDKDRDIILLKLNKDIKYIVQKTENPQNENINLYYKGKQCNIEDYEFDSNRKDKETDCIII